MTNRAKALVTTTLTALGLILTAHYANSAELDAGIVHDGECQMLIVKGNDLSDGCSDKILQMVYDNGRIGFTLPVGDKGTVITFSGMLKPEYSNDDQLQTVDAIILNLNIDGVPPTTNEVSGECKYSNPYHGQMGINCNATSQNGSEYHLRFRTDGEPTTMPSYYEDALLPYGSRAGMNVTMTSASGIGTAKARIGIVHTRQNAKAFCLDYSHDISPQCVNETLSENEFPKAITANCRTGTFTAANGMAYQFRGRNKKPSLDVPGYRISELKSKKLLPDIGASSYGVAFSSLEKLCPNLL